MTDALDWQGKVGDSWAAEWQRTDRSFTQLTQRLHDTISSRAPESGHAIDIGCGAGETSLGLALAKPGVAVTGIDLSADLLAIARSRAADIRNVRFVQKDAVVGVADLATVDLYVSRHGVMFFDNPVAAFTAFRQAAAPNAQMIFSCFRDWTLNAFAYEVALLAKGAAPKADAPGPFAFAERDRVADILEASGWKNIHAEAFDFNYIAGEGTDPVVDAMSFMRRIGPAARAIADASEDERPALIDGLHEICEKYRTGNAILFPAAAWIWSADI